MANIGHPQTVRRIAEPVRAPQFDPPPVREKTPEREPVEVEVR